MGEEEGYDSIEEKELPFESWLMASPLPKMTFEPKKESGSGTCNKSLFVSTSSSKTLATINKEGDVEVEQRTVSRPDEEDKVRKGKEKEIRGGAKQQPQ